MRFLILGGIERPGSDVGYQGLLMVVDWSARKILHRMEYRSPPEIRNPGPKGTLTTGYVTGDTLLCCTSTECLIMKNLEKPEIVRTFSHKGFNDLHHMIPFEGGYAVANTGLETVDILDAEGHLLRRHDMLEHIGRSRVIDPEVDYRKFVDLKPDHVHANYLRQDGDRLWCTRCLQKDCIDVHDPGTRIDIAVGNPHDGFLRGDTVYFTTTNGKIVIASASTHDVERVVDLQALSGSQQLGWCRGLEIDGPFAYVGLTAFRESSHARTFGRWIRRSAGAQTLPSRICKYDLVTERFLEEWMILGDNAQWIVFSIHRLD